MRSTSTYNGHHRPAPVAAEECVRRDSGSIDALISERRMSLTELADRWPEIA